jgi:hypothetical protein
MQRQLVELGKVTEHIAAMGAAIDNTLKTGAGALHEAADKAISRVDEIPRIYADRSRGLE